MRELRTAFLLTTVCAAGFGYTLVVPNFQSTAPGYVAIDVKPVVHIQQVLGGGQFPGPIVITGLRLRAAAGTGPVSFSYPSLKITLSSTRAFPNTLNGHTLPSTTYANNVGPDAVTVYNAPLAVSSRGCRAGPCLFDIAVPFSTPFSFDPSQGRLLVDLVTSSATGTPTGSLDGVVFINSTVSTVATISGDPTAATGTLALGGVVIGLDTRSLSGSFGFLIQTSLANPSNDVGAAMLGIMNFDGAGNVSGPYTLEISASGNQTAQTVTGTFMGTYSTNPDGTGSVTISTDMGLSLSFALVISDSGQSVQLVTTKLIGGDISGTVIGGAARAGQFGFPLGSYGFQLNTTPLPGVVNGVVSFDDAGNAKASFTVVSVGKDPNQPPVFTGTESGTYTINDDGTGTINLTTASGQPDSPVAFVITDGGAGLLLLQTVGSGSSVQFGTARVQ
jgi:hypothetical protein